MAFEGDLTNLGLADIFQTLGMNRQSGTLVVKYGETERRFYFTDEGVSLLTTRSARKFRLGNLLVGMGKLSEGDLKVAILKQERAKDTKLGDILLQTGLVKTEDIKEACKYQAAEEIYDSFNWKSGKFQFLEGANAGPAGGPGPFAEFFFQVTDIVMEAARRSDEFAMNLQKIGAVEEFYVRKPGSEATVESVGRPASLLYSMLDGTMDVKQIFEEFHLSPFDTSQAFVTLVEQGQIQTMGAAELRQAAGPFLQAKDFVRAARLLGRAAKIDPKDPDLLASLAEAESKADQRKEASRTYTALGELHREREQKVEAVEALRKAIEHDSRNEHAYELVMEVHAALDQFDKSEDACREAARLLSDDRDFEASLRILERGLGFLPESVQLRLQRANCLLALGKKDDGLKEMAAVGADLEAKKGDAKLTLSVYKKLLQLEPENKDYKEKVEDLVRGEKARETRKKMARVAAVIGGLALLGVGYTLLPEGRGTKLARAAEWVRSGSPDERKEAEAILKAIAEDTEPDSEEGSKARAALLELEKVNAAPLRRKRVEEVEGRLKASILVPAADLMKEGKYVEGAARVLEVLPEIRNPALKEIEGDELNGLRLRVQKECMDILSVPANALREDAKIVKAALSDVGNVDVPKVDEARQKEVLEKAGRALQVRGKTEWKPVVDALRKAVGPGQLSDPANALRVADLALTLDQMLSGLDSLQDTHGRADAEVRQRAVQTAYGTANASLREAKAAGNLAKGIAACDAFLAVCDELRRARPGNKYLGPVVERLFDTFKMDGEIREGREALRKVDDSLARAKAAEARGDVQAAFDIIKETITKAQDVSFQGLARLPLQVVTRPPGAALTVVDSAGKVVAELKTPYLIHYPYQGKTTLRLAMEGFEPAALERKGIDGDRDAVITVDLQRHKEWGRSVGAAVEGHPGLAPGLVLIGTRGGLLLALSIETGEEQFQVDTKDLSGISGGILVAGDQAFFGGMDGEAFCVDWRKRALAWRKPAGGPVEKSPVLCGAHAVFCTNGGGIRAFLARDGAEAWRKDLGVPVSGGLLAAGDLVLAAMDDNRLVALRAADGSEAWSVKLPAPVCGSLASDGKGGVVLTTETPSVERRSAKDGSLTWSAKVDAPVRAQAAVRGGTVLAVTSRGTAYHLAAADGTVQGTGSLGAAVEGGATELDGTLYVAASGGALIAYRIEAREVLWKRTGVGQLLGAPAVSKEILVIASADSSGAVVAVKP